MKKQGLDAPLLCSNDDRDPERPDGRSIMREPNPNTVADGYSRTDQRVPIATSTTPVAPPLDFDYNDGVNAADRAGDFANDVGDANYGSTHREEEEDDVDGGGGGGGGEDSRPLRPHETGVDRHLPHPDRPRLLQTHEGEHRYDHGDAASSVLKVTRHTKIYAFCAALNSCNLGYDIGVNTGAGPLLQSSLGLTDLQVEIFMGSLNLYAMVGALSSHWISDRLGRRWAFRVAAMGFIFGTVIQSGAGGYASLMLGRAFVGCGVGFGLAVDPVYIGEISQAAHRGQLVTWSEIATNVGILLGFVAGLVFADVDEGVAWRLMFALGAILPCVVIYVSVSRGHKNTTEMWEGRILCAARGARSPFVGFVTYVVTRMVYSPPRHHMHGRAYRERNYRYCTLSCPRSHRCFCSIQPKPKTHAVCILPTLDVRHARESEMAGVEGP